MFDCHNQRAGIVLAQKTCCSAGAAASQREGQRYVAVAHSKGARHQTVQHPPVVSELLCPRRLAEVEAQS